MITHRIVTIPSTGRDSEAIGDYFRKNTHEELISVVSRIEQADCTDITMYVKVKDTDVQKMVKRLVTFDTHLCQSTNAYDWVTDDQRKVIDDVIDMLYRLEDKD